MRLRVGLDARGLNTNFIRGMGEYIGSLIGSMSPVHEIAWSLYGHRPDLPLHRPPECDIERIVVRDVRGHRFHMWEQAFLPFEVARNRVDVLHCASTTSPLLQPVPTVVTIHDTIPWETGEDMAPGFYRDWLLPKAYAKCRAIITISNHSRNDIVRRWPRLADKVRVIPHGIAAEYRNCAPAAMSDRLRELGIDRPYLLYVGGSILRKRLQWTLDLYRALERPDISLVVCGVAVAQHGTFRDRLPEGLRAQVIFLPYIAAQDMPRVYQNAIAVLYPTLYEGFGFPALNAQAVGTPVILSAVSSLLELIGPTSVALPPDDTAAWLDVCRTLIDQRQASCVPDEASRIWTRRFDWSNAARAHWEVYQAAAGLTETR